ncbi:3',5'-cyclic AMP phosphodiesterase CpdA [Roseateles sp. YR242]|uniref:metallophosphoesterase family protein n=1 Tax=Roseateles sp. YR242 TaxID=1855305 RepID=UPI0008C8B792|nr:metallophosphoesterase [Roseateles sp. YR242]SEL45035.1 3',5'-cyclic AMP phosphodiesterase CpdA [Roseateles sp. YR242]
MTLLMQVSDPHFGTERPAVLAALEQLWRDRAPDLLLITGDVTQRARVPEFRAARAFVDRLKPRAQLAIPGNHDIPLFDLWSRCLHPYRRYQRHFQPALEGEFDDGEVCVLALNTTRWYRHKHGEVSTVQIARVTERLRAAADRRCRVIAVHQPVAVTRDSDLVNLLRGHEAAVAAWAQAGADLIIGGHIHLPFVVALRERWPSLARPMWAVQAGTALSTRVRADVTNSVNLIRLEAEWRVERWDFEQTQGRFAQVGVNLLR